MHKSESRLTVYFEQPFWVGVYERIGDGLLEAAKITFGAEPKDQEVYDYLLKHWSSLSFTPAVPCAPRSAHLPNPKRAQRVIQAQLSAHGGSTKSQQALALQREQSKLQRREHTKAEKEQKQLRQFELRQKKRRAKHRGH